MVLELTGRKKGVLLVSSGECMLGIPKLRSTISISSSVKLHVFVIAVDHYCPLYLTLLIQSTNAKSILTSQMCDYVFLLHNFVS